MLMPNHTSQRLIRARRKSSLAALLRTALLHQSESGVQKTAPRGTQETQLNSMPQLQLGNPIAAHRWGATRKLKLRANENDNL
jgi:hypothetical protein